MRTISDGFTSLVKHSVVVKKKLKSCLSVSVQLSTSVNYQALLKSI